jgi:hypothetical protein
MSEPVALSVKPPQLGGDKLGAATRIDRALKISLGPVTQPDGSPLASPAVGAFLYRVGNQGEQVWNASARAWAADPGEEALGATVPPLPLAATVDAAAPWATTLAAPPPLDANGRPQIEVAQGENPKYFVRALVTANAGSTSFRGVSPPSASLSLVEVASIAIPAPSLAWKGGGPFAPIEKEIDVGLPALTLPDGSAVTSEDVVALGMFVYRADGLWWNDKEQQWQPAPAGVEALAQHKPLALSLQQGKTPPWQGKLAASGQKDKDDAPRYVPVNDGGSSYRLRAFAHLKRGSRVYLGLSAPTPDLLFIRTLGEERFKIEFDTDGPQDCTQATVRLADAAGRRCGWLKLRSAERDVEIASIDAGGNVRARLRLTTDGDIELAPAPGRRVIALADFECERVRYRPAGGGLKQDLP